jgi:hypothetical protein
MTTDQPPRLFKPLIKEMDDDTAYCSVDDVDTLIKSAIEREEYILNKLQEINKNLDAYNEKLHQLIIHMRESR